jgi:hypothetical protein
MNWFEAVWGLLMGIAGVLMMTWNREFSEMIRDEYVSPRYRVGLSWYRIGCIWMGAVLSISAFLVFFNAITGPD